MPTTIIDRIPGVPFDAGRPYEEALSIYHKLAKGHPTRLVALIRHWQWLDIDIEGRPPEEIPEDFNPNMMYSSQVMRSSQSYLNTEMWTRSSELKGFTDNCIFESQNSFYIMVGAGTRKTVTPRNILDM
jgi:hypothetical protein